MSSFRCKQFTVEQHKCAMKVGTDSLILGSWADPSGHSTMLDIGTGSGILSLMMMQRADTDAVIDAIDIDDGAVSQATDNARRSPWANRIQVAKADVTTWQPPRRYSLIISNPPYFNAPGAPTNAFSGQSPERQLARNAMALSPVALLKFVSTYLSSSGLFYCLYPSGAMPSVIHEAESLGLNIQRQLDVRHSPEHACYVSALCMGRAALPLQRSMLTIRNDKGNYSEAYRALCQPYYLHF